MFKAKTNLFLLFLALFFSVITDIKAQNFGNEWINHSQKYLKIKISQEGLYGINVNQIIQSGLVSQNIDPRKFQLFCKGQPIPLYITGDADNLFDGNDKIVFYGKTNDSSLDKILYKLPQDIPNEEISLFEDDNYYFLTYNEAGSGLRFTNFARSSAGLSPETYIIYKSRVNYASTYYPGEYILSGMSPSEYIEGEGYLGAVFGIGESFSTSINTPNFISTPEFQPSFSTYVAGRSNAASTNSENNNHHLRVTVNGSLVADTVYRGYKTIRKKTPVTVNNAISSIVFASINDLGALTDFQAPAYSEIIYSRQLSLNSINEIKFNLNNSRTNAYLAFTNANISSPILLDISTNFFFNGTKSGSNLEFVVNNNQENKTYFLGDLDNLKSVTLENVTFRAFSASDIKSFLMISNKTLASGVNSYVNYNNTRNVTTTVAYTEDLYNEFYYGFHHPLAIKNFCAWALDNGNIKPEYLLLLGKGMEYPKTQKTTDLVPTLGYPASDNMLTSGLNGSILEPGLATGRIPAKTNEEIENYLNKLKTYNQLPNEIWRKNLLFISGGNSSSENSSFINYQNSLFSIAKGNYFGGRQSSISKNVIAPITENQTERIIKEAEEGLSLISFLGHGSATETEISFGAPLNHRNKNKPTIYIVNGCSTGAVYGNNYALGEQFILTKDYGAVGWIATTSEGVASYLTGVTRNFYNNWFVNMYGESIAKGFKAGLKTYQQSNDRLNVAHVRQYVFLGDPLLKLYSPSNPDYEIKNTDISYDRTSLNPKKNIVLKVSIKNLGKTLGGDSIVVRMQRTLPDNSVLTLPLVKIKPVFNTDTIELIVNNAIDQNVIGNNKITISIDPNNQIQELTKLNNTAILDIFIPGNGLNLIFPLRNGIISNTADLKLKAQPDNLFTKNAEYLFEIDTTISFSSPAKKASEIINSGLFAEWKPNIILENGKVYFWRARLNLPENEGGAWSNSSFTYIQNSDDGFNISHKSQFQNLNFNNATLKENSDTFEFNKTFFPTSIQTEGDDGGAPYDKRFRTTQTISYASIGFVGLTLVSYDPLVLKKKFSYPTTFNSWSGPDDEVVNGYTGQYFWNTNNPEEVDSLVRYINQIPRGYYVIGYNGLNTTINALPEAAKNALKSIGLNKYDLVNEGEPYMFWGIKGAAPGSVLEFTADYSSNIPPRAQRIRHVENIPYPLSSGSVKTDLIGPAKEWKNIELKYFNNQNDQITYDVFGIDNSGTEQQLISNSNSGNIDLTQINASSIPYIKIKSNFEDNVEYNIPKLNYWKVNYTPATEITFNPEFSNNFHLETIQEGDSIKWTLGITNLSKYETDSVEVNYTITKSDNTTINKSLKKLARISAGGNSEIKIEESSVNLGGKNSLKVEFKISSSKDQYAFNNVIYKDFTVLKDNKEAILNVLFDGKSIINGDIISPEPIINISLKDENNFLLLKDTSALEIFLKREEETTYKKISYASGNLKLTPATTGEDNRLNVEFKPNKLEDGKYTLKVKSKDVSGNTNNSNDYEIEFEVINESSISNFYPYPNPVVNAMKFVFTLTGSRVPDKIRVRILTASGKVIREVLKHELGNLRIGNNISDFTWDGTDQFGDRLANGVYFYRVDIEDNDIGPIKHRFTKGDQFFKNNTGKIYLLR